MGGEAGCRLDGLRGGIPALVGKLGVALVREVDPRAANRRCGGQWHGRARVRGSCRGPRPAGFLARADGDPAGAPRQSPVVNRARLTSCGSGGSTTLWSLSA